MTRVAAWLAADASGVFRALRLAPDALDRLRRARLAGLLLDAGRRVPLYAASLGPPGTAGQLAGGVAEALLAELPPMTKPDLRAAGDAVLRDGRVDPRWLSSSSSGSTGEPFRVYYEPRAWATLKYLVKLRARAACRVRPIDRVLVLDAIPPAAEGQLPLERLGRLRRVSVLQPAERIADRVTGFRPRAMYGLPSALLDLAQTLGDESRRLGVAALFTSGELLQSAARRTLVAAYGAPVFDVYGTSETKEIAWECRAGGRHVNADIVWVEILDAAGAPAAPGEEGDIVVTTLVNRAMPLIRYRTGDRGALLAERCRCGLALPLLGVVTGREADMLEFSNGRRVSPYALTCALEGVGELDRYQVKQLDRRTLRVRVRAEAAVDADGLQQRIRQALCEQVGVGLEVDVEYVDHFVTGPRAKFRVVEPLRELPDAPPESVGS